MGVLTAILLLTGSIFSLVYIFYKKKFQFWRNLKVVHPNPSFPFGNLHFGRTIGQNFCDIYKQFPNEPFVGLWVLFRPLLLVRDPDLIKDILVKDFMTFHDRGVYSNPEVDPLTGNLFLITGSRWKNLRVKLTPTFTSGKMKMMFQILLECCKQFDAAMEKTTGLGKIVEMKDFCARFTTDIIAMVAFGINADSLNNPDAEFRHYGAKSLAPSLKTNLRFSLLFLAPKIAEFFSMRAVDKDIELFFANAIRESIEHRKNNNIKRNDFLDLLIQLQKTGKLDDDTVIDSNTATQLTFDEVLAQAFVFFTAGFETSSTTMQFALYQLAKNPDIQRKTRDDINNALAKNNGQLTYETLNEMHYLARVVDETLRMYPPLPFLQRECNENHRVPQSNLTIPKGTVVMIDLLGMQNDPKYFHQPEVFNPDRFTEEGKASRPNFTYKPFGEGPRNCIGSRFGLMQTKVGLATLLKNFEFRVCHKTLDTMTFESNSLILSPKGGMHLYVEKIHS